MYYLHFGGTFSAETFENSTCIYENFFYFKIGLQWGSSRILVRYEVFMHQKFIQSSKKLPYQCFIDILFASVFTVLRIYFSLPKPVVTVHNLYVVSVKWSNSFILGSLVSHIPHLLNIHTSEFMSHTILLKSCCKFWLKKIMSRYWLHIFVNYIKAWVSFEQISWNNPKRPY